MTETVIYPRPDGVPEDDGVGDAAFMDEAVKVGNGWASAPVEAANGEWGELAQTA